MGRCSFVDDVKKLYKKYFKKRVGVQNVKFCMPTLFLCMSKRVEFFCYLSGENKKGGKIMERRICFVIMVLLTQVFVHAAQQQGPSQTLALRSEPLYSIRLDSSPTQSPGVQSSSTSLYYQQMKTGLQNVGTSMKAGATNAYNSVASAVKPVGSFMSRQATNFSNAVQPGIDFLGRQASTVASSVKSAYNAGPNIGLEVGLQKAGSVVKSGVTKVSSAASAAYNKVVSTELGYQAKLLVSPQERRQVAEYQKEGIKDLSLSLFGDHEGPGDILNLHQERQKTEALSRELQKEGLSKPAVKSYMDNKQNIRIQTDKNNEGIENLQKESQKMSSRLEDEIVQIRLKNQGVDFSYLERDRLRVMQMQDPVKQNQAFKELQEIVNAKKNGSSLMSVQGKEIIDGEIHESGEWF